MFAPPAAKAKTGKNPTNQPASSSSTPAARPFGSGAGEEVLMLQRSVGNRATLRLLSRQARVGSEDRQPGNPPLPGGGAAAVLADSKPTVTLGAPLAIARDSAQDPAAAKLHDAEQYGDAALAFRKHNSSLSDDVLSKIRSGIIKVADASKTYEVAYSFFDFYSSVGNSIRQMKDDEEAKARRADRYAETDTTLGFTTTTLRSDVLGWDDKKLAVLLLHEFSHKGHVSGDIAGSGSYQEGQSYGIEYFYAEVAGDDARMKKIQGIVSAGEVLGYSKPAFLGRFQEDFKVTYALLTAFSEVVKRGSSPHLPFPELTGAGAQLLESQVVTSFQNPSADLAKYITYVRAHLSSFSLPAI